MTIITTKSTILFATLLLQTLIPTSSYFSHIQFKAKQPQPSSPPPSKFGCLAATFSGDPAPPTSLSATSTFFDVELAQPVDACVPSSSDLVATEGGVLFIRRGGCSFFDKAIAAFNAGATGVVLIDTSVNAVLPITAAAAPSFSATLKIPVCMVTYNHGEEMLSQLQSGVSHQIDFTNAFPDADVLEQSSTTPAERYYTYVDVLTPFQLKFRYPAAIALYSPRTAQNLPEAEEVVEAEFEVICEIPYNTNPNRRCQSCYATKVTNAEEVIGNFAFFSGRYSASDSPENECARSQDYSAMAQNAGALGVLLPYIVPGASSTSLDQIGPLALPFETTIFTYMIQTGVAGFMGNYLNSANREEVVARFPPTNAEGWGESYFPDPDTNGALPQTQICFESMTNVTCFEAGQASFNPENSQALQGEIVVGELAEECAGSRAAVSDETDCSECHDKIDDGTVFENSLDLDGKIVFIDALDTFCINEWEELINNADSHSAIAMIVGNEPDSTHTMIDANDDNATLPVFNIRKSTKTWLTELLSTGNTVTANLPAIVDGKALNSTSYFTTGQDSIPLTQLKLKSSSGSAKVAAGQTNFNPIFEGVSLLSTTANFYQFCSSKASCHLCNLLDNPVVESTEQLRGKVVLIEVAQALCILPISNAALFVQNLGAAAVLFVNTQDHLVTLIGGENVNTLIDIPSFNVERSTGFDIVRVLQQGFPIEITLPDIEFVGGGRGNEAGETIGISIPQEDVVADEGGGNAIERDPPVDVETRVVFGTVSGLVLLFLVISGIGGRTLYVRRKRTARLVAYNQLSSGTQVENPLIFGSDGEARWPANSETVASASAQPINRSGVGWDSGRVVIARPWNSGGFGGGGGEDVELAPITTPQASMVRFSFTTEVATRGQGQNL